MNIDDFTNFKQKTIAEFTEAFALIDKLKKECLKKKDIKGFFQAVKYDAKLRRLYDKKIAHGSRHGYDSHKRMH